MAKQIFYTLFLFLLSTAILTASSSAPGAAITSKRAINFIQASCKATTYPTVCVNSLTGYANSIQTSPRRLAETALNVTVTQAQSTKVFVWRLGRFTSLKNREIQAVKDCIEEIHDAVDRLTMSIHEVKMCGSAKGRDQFWFHMSNAQTWTSAALTNANTCSDGFAGRVMDGRVKNSVRARILNLGRGTSNALALINAFAKKY
ncbi:Invertase/pectin methylesterase inhibitor domain superfamily [Arabidopsis suecica]|uniref:Invertase/pectin methylesterase inhibitor domain superfamily n=1 Tax=Arabidopsis suecica TaxID=45249 RepID=A0A8T2FBB9_ARASU|nr:Invertase/pectin methylesterase inhibitor domain superfamily [Arabidopsis suecica]